jgi:hypothetical protein
LVTALSPVGRSGTGRLATAAELDGSELDDVEAPMSPPHPETSAAATKIATKAAVAVWVSFQP